MVIECKQQKYTKYKYYNIEIYLAILVLKYYKE